MALEIEAKYRVEDHAPIRDRLRASGATHLSTVIETNRIFDRADGELRRQGCGLRVRSCRAVDGGADFATWTVKGPRRPSRLKVRDEHEVGVSDAAVACDALGLLGFTPILEYEKKRETWRLHECSVELDTPALIGCYVEIEGESEADIVKVQAALGLADSALVSNS